ncbi:hypothetical protein LTR17_014208 [Elasticomyces elasticus]|nr:hypothetical protein LTR17_014208 [Elasticomyces elasticus]
MADYLSSAASNLAKNASETVQQVHPYLPKDAIILNWAANEWSVPVLLTYFFGLCAILFVSTYFIAKRVDKTLTTGELTTIMWFVLSGCIHLFLEGYYATFYATLAAKQTFLGQLWKEYAHGDSRYLSNNSFVLCMETVTAVFWGPGCLATAAMIMLRHPLRYPIQMIVSMGQLYGVILYYATSAFDEAVNGVTYSRPEFLYYWFYFVIMNAFWTVIPAWLIYQSTVQTAKAVRKVQQMESTKKVL